MGKFSNTSKEKKSSETKTNGSPMLLLGIVVVILIIAGLWLFVFSKPSYPDITSPRPVAGNPNATILIEEFSDLECPACKAAQLYVDPILVEFSDQVRFEYKHYPLNVSCNNAVNSALHPNACESAYAAECANDQGKFYEFVKWAFDNQNSLSNGGLKNGASSLGLDRASFDACLDSQAKRDEVTADVDEGNRRGVSATPTFYVNGERVRDYTVLRAFILSKIQAENN